MVDNFYFRTLTMSIVLASTASFSACNSSGSSSHGSSRSSLSTTPVVGDPVEPEEIVSTSNILSYGSSFERDSDGKTTVKRVLGNSFTIKKTEQGKSFTKIDPAVVSDYDRVRKVPGAEEGKDANGNPVVVWRDDAKTVITKSDGSIVNLDSDHFVVTNGCNPASAGCQPISYYDADREQTEAADFGGNDFEHFVAMQDGKRVYKPEDVNLNGGEVTIESYELSSEKHRVDGLSNSDFGSYEETYTTVKGDQVNDEAAYVIHDGSYSHYYTVDTATAVAKMDALKNNGVKATYHGRFVGQYTATDADGNLVNNGDTSGDIRLNADFGKGEVTGTTDEIHVDQDNTDDSIATGVAMSIQGNISGNTYSGGSRFVDGNGAAIGSNVSGSSEGAFAGANAQETVGALATQGTINGNNVVVSGSYGATTSDTTPTN